MSISWEDKIRKIDEDGEGLTKWEIDFIAGLIDEWIDSDHQRSLSDKQKDQIDRLYINKLP